MISRHILGHASALAKALIASACLAGAAAGVAACDSPDSEAIPAATVDELGAKPGDSPSQPPAQAPPPAAGPTPTVAASPADGNYLDFVGAWTSTTSPIATIVFENTVDGAGHHFFAHARVASNVKGRIEGVFTLPKGDLVLDAKGSSFSGTYVYGFKSPNELKIGSGADAHVFTRQPSYCDQPADCAGQGIIHVMCVGAFSCDKSHTCNWVCGGQEEPPQEPPSGPACGPNTVCGSGQVCCNESCGICTKPGQGCTKQLCAPPSGPKCGTTTCNAGEVCCNASCGVCTKPGGACTQQICPVNQ